MDAEIDDPSDDVLGPGPGEVESVASSCGSILDGLAGTVKDFAKQQDQLQNKRKLEQAAGYQTAMGTRLC